MVPVVSDPNLQICRALNYIHRVIGVCHRDIKPQNLLVCIFIILSKWCIVVSELIEAFCSKY